MRLGRSTFLLLILIILTAGHAPADQSRGIESSGQSRLFDKTEYHALIVGVENYTAGRDSVIGAVDEAHRVSEALKNLGFKVRVVLNPKASELKKELKRFVFKTGSVRNRSLLFYFVGHGDTNVLADGNKQGYLIPADCPTNQSNPARFYRRSISIRRLEENALLAKSKQMLMVFNACFSGINFSARQSASTTIDEKTARPVRQFLVAGRQGEKSAAGGVFMKTFIEAFSGKADLNKDGYLTGNELGVFLPERVVNKSNGAQNPRFGWINNQRMDKGDFVFVLKPAEDPDQPGMIKTDLQGGERRRMGQMTIRSNVDGARFNLSGRWYKTRSNASLFIGSVPVGEHEIIVRKEGYQDWAGRFRIEPGRPLEIFIKMARKGSRPTGSGTGPTVEEEIPLVGKVRVIANVDGAIFELAGKSFTTKSRRAMVISSVPVGEYQVRAVKEGYPDWTGKLVVEFEKRTDLVIRMSQQLAQVSTTTAPPESTSTTTSTNPTTTTTTSTAPPTSTTETTELTTTTTMPESASGQIPQEPVDQPLEHSQEGSQGEAEEEPEVERAASPEERIARLLEAAEEDIRQNRLTTPSPGNAYEKLLQVLEMDPENETAKDGLVRIRDRYLSLAEKKKGEADWRLTAHYLKLALKVDPEAEGVAEELALAQDEHHLALAQELFNKDQPEKAAERLAMIAGPLVEDERYLALKTRLETGAADLERGRTLVEEAEADLQAGNPEAARAKIEEAGGLIPHDPGLADLKTRVDQLLSDKLNREIEAALEAGDPDRATEAHNRLTKINPQDDRLAELADELAELREETRLTAGDDLFRRAEQAFRTRKLHQARQLLAKARKIIPEDGRLELLGKKLEKQLKYHPPKNKNYFTNSVGMRFKAVPAGRYMMGSKRSLGVPENEQPRHGVRISRPLWVGIYEVTHEEWQKVMGDRPSGSMGTGRVPVNNVSFKDIRRFIKRLNEKEFTDAYRLPTEAEWEYFCRAGTTTDYSFGNDSKALNQFGWHMGIAGFKPRPVGGKVANPWGLYDLHGNVAEFCSDYYSSTYYARSPETDPPGPGKGKARVIRGGSWMNMPGAHGSATRVGGFKATSVGFRLVREK